MNTWYFTVIAVLVVGIIAGGLLWRNSLEQNAVQAPPVTKFIPVGKKFQVAMFAGGCFWCVESDMEKVPGVQGVVSGYASGTSENPTYKDYASGGHREVVLVTYDPNRVTYRQLAVNLIKHSDPTDPDGSFFDRGHEYSPAIYYATEVEKADAEEVIRVIDEMKVYERPIAVTVEPLTTFWPAEEYHQNYYGKNGLRYHYYRSGSGRDDFIEQHWGDDANDLSL